MSGALLAPTRKVKVWKEPAGSHHQFAKMWRGHCFACGKTAQFWSFGATLGYMLEHIRRCDRFRYAPSLAKRPNGPVSSEVRLPILSGQEQRGGEELFSHEDSSSLLNGWPHQRPGGW